MFGLFAHNPLQQSIKVMVNVARQVQSQHELSALDAEPGGHAAHANREVLSWQQVLCTVQQTLHEPVVLVKPRTS